MLASRTRFGSAQGGEQARQLGPGRADQLADRSHPDIGDQRPQDLHDWGIGQGTITDRHTAPDQHSRPLGSAAGRQLGDQAGLANTGLAPHQDDSRVSICGPPPGRLQELQLLDPADEGRAAHAAAHLAGIIARDRPEGNGGRTSSATRCRMGSPTKDGEPPLACVWHMPDSGRTVRRDPEPAGDDRHWQATEETMQVKQPPQTVSAAQHLRRTSATLDAEAGEHPAPSGVRNGRVRHVLVLTALTLLAALALALTIATLAVAPADPAPPPPTSPMQFGPSMGHARPY